MKEGQQFTLQNQSEAWEYSRQVAQKEYSTEIIVNQELIFHKAMKYIVESLILKYYNPMQ